MEKDLDSKMSTSKTYNRNMEIQTPIRQSPAQRTGPRHNQYEDQPYTDSFYPTAGSSISGGYINKIMFHIEQLSSDRSSLVVPLGSAHVKTRRSNLMYVENALTPFIAIRLIAETYMLK